MRITACNLIPLVLLFSSGSISAADVDREVWRNFVGQAGPSGWHVHVIHPDPHDHGPDGFNSHDWDDDGHIDAFINYEEGHYSRLYFNPGPRHVEQVWNNYIQFNHEKCEDSGIGDLDNDGDVDYIANGSTIYFNPGAARAHDVGSWATMETGVGGRTPTVADIDGDGLNDLILGSGVWLKQPRSDKHNRKSWTTHTLGSTGWIMTTRVLDIDGDGDQDILMNDRKVGTYYFKNPGIASVTDPWEKVMIGEVVKSTMMMDIGDVNGDGRLDIVRAGKKNRSTDIFLRVNDNGSPTYHLVQVPSPPHSEKQGLNGGKGVALMEMNGDVRHPELVFLPEHRSQGWFVSLTRGDGSDPSHWENTLLDIPGASTHGKMDNVYLADLDGDGDLDIATTEENDGWGVMWFENPAR